MSDQKADEVLTAFAGWNMTDSQLLEQEHEAKKRRIEAIREILDRYVTGQIDNAEATAEIEEVTHAK